MLKSIQQRDLNRNRWIKITMAVILGAIIISMVVTLVPGLMSGPGAGDSPDTIVSIGGQNLTVTEFQQEFDRATRNQPIAEMMRGVYSRQILEDLIFQRALIYEAGRLGISVTPEEESERIKEIVPAAWSGNTWLRDRYTTEVETQLGMTVEDFEKRLRDSMIEVKFRDLVTDGLAVTPADIEQEFRWRNEQVKIEYALIKPADLAASIHPSEDELSAWFAKNSAHYSIPEKRSARYALLDVARLRAATQVGDDALRAYYAAHRDEYKVENRVHPEHILFKTVGKTDAEVAEIRKKAEDVLKQARHGSNFEELAKKYSEDDGTKPKGGDLGWIVEGQTVPEFQQAAFSMPSGAVSDLVKTQYGFHIIKVLERETAHIRSFEEVRDSILQVALDQNVSNQVNNLSEQMASAIRQSNRQSLDDLAKKFHLELGETSPAAITEPAGQLGASSDLHQTLFQLRPGELSQPVQVDAGFALLAVKDILPAHQATFAEVHDRVLADYQREKSVELARTRAEDLAKRAQAGEDLGKAAKALDLTSKTSESFARGGAVPDLGTGKQIASAFRLAVGQASAPTLIAGNWVVFRVVARQAADPADFPKQKDAIEQQLLRTKQEAAFAAFRTALVDRLKKEGKLSINTEVVNRLTKSS
ncbi:MAG: peptidylprolyl isomerase [Acidobacteriia bacterium]|nr:peptidylprolyl isomerase [Terriglobia bacterium]